MKEIVGKLALAALCIAATGSALWAQAQPPPGPRIEVAVADGLVLKKGEIRPTVRDSTGNLVTRPGDVIRYTLTATNRGREPAHNVEVVDPIPAGTEYVLGSAKGKGARISYSIDSGRFYQQPPVVYEFRLPDGSIEKRPAPADLYTHVKWTITQPIPPGGSVPITLQVRVKGNGVTRGGPE